MTDFYYIFSWWLFLIFMGAVTFPLSTLLFKKFFDSGYGFSKTLNILILSFCVFLLSTLRLVPFTRSSLVILSILFAALNLYIYLKRRLKINSLLGKILPYLLFEELLFGFGLLLWSYVRAHQPDINGLEKFMDFGFVNSILKSRYLPPADMWFAGKSINYYWYGHYVAAFLIKLTNTPSAIGYNLMLATILGLSLTGSFSLITSLVTNFKKGLSKRKVVLAGLVSAILLNFAGNFHTPFYILKNGKDAYWYPDATRFIGYNPDVNDKTIHEFPIYSYVVSDLHAHLLNLPFVLFFLALLYAGLSNKKSRKIIAYPTLGITLGIMFMTNAWDFANYLLVAGFVFLYYFIRRKGITFDSLYKTAIPLVVIISLAIVTVLPFVLHFESIAQGVKLTHTKTPLWQLAILWGFPAVMAIIFSIKILLSKIRKKEDFYVLALLTSSFILIALPEFIYVKDIYAETHYRANTMFKLTYQAFVMSYLCAGYIVVRTIDLTKRIYKKVLLAIFFSLIFGSIMYYPFNATKGYYGDMKIYRGLSGDTWLRDKNPDLFTATTWLQQNVSGQPTILEAPGDSYTEYDSVSSYTGLPTVSGWYVHEWLWRGSPDFPQARVNDITQIYTSDNISVTRSLLKKYNVQYVIIGTFEREKFPNLIEDKFPSLGKEVFTSPTTKIYQLN